MGEPHTAPTLRSVMILSEKSSGSTALLRLLTSSLVSSTVSITPHAQSETLYWVKAAALLDRPQLNMVDSVVPIDQSVAREQIESLIGANAVGFSPPEDDRQLIFDGWHKLCESHQPVFVEKSPHHLCQWSALELMLEAIEMIPDVDFRFVGLVRNPLDTIYSQYRRWRSRPESVENQWRHAYNNLLRLERLLGDRLTRVRYEDLVQGVEPLRHVLDLCGVDATAAAGWFGASSGSRWREDKSFGFSLDPSTIRLAERFGYRQEEVLNARKRSWPVRREVERAKWLVARRIGSAARAVGASRGSKGGVQTPRSDSRLHFVFVINSLDAGGAEFSLVETLAKARREIDVTIVCLKRGGGAFEEEAAGSGISVEIAGGATLPAQILAVRRRLRHLQPSLVYTSLFDADLVGRLAAFGTGIPVVSSVVNTSYGDMRLADPNISKVKLELARRVDAFTARHLVAHVHAISETTRVAAIEDLGLNPANITVVRRGRDPRRFPELSSRDRRSVRDRLGVGSELVVLNVGRQEFQKGQDVLVEAAASVTIPDEGLVILVAGREGNATSALRRDVDRWQVEDRIRFLGHRSDIGEIMAAVDLFVFPSRFEGLGGAVVEAMAAGLPIVASDLPAMREILDPGGNAILVPIGDPCRLAAAISELATDSEKRRGMGARSRQMFVESFQLEPAADALMGLLKQVAVGERG